MIRVSFSLFLSLSVFCYFTLLLIFIKIILLLLLLSLLFFFFMKIIFIFSCSGMFRDVPECSGMFRHVPRCSMFRVLSTPEVIRGVLFNLVRLVRKGTCELTTRKNFVFQLDHTKFGSSDSLNDQSCGEISITSKIFAIKISKISVRDGRVFLRW